MVYKHPQSHEAQAMQPKEIPGFAGYYCDQDGNVYTTRKKGRHLEKFGPMRLMQPRRRRDGYLQAHFRVDGKEYAPLVHQVVMMTWGPPGSGEVNHKNGVKSDNRLENLEWCTRLENVHHARNVLGKRTNGERHGAARLTAEQVREIRALRADGVTGREIATKFGISRDYVYQIAQRDRWGHLE